MMGSMDLCCAMHEFLPRDIPWYHPSMSHAIQCPQAVCCCSSWLTVHVGIESLLKALPQSSSMCLVGVTSLLQLVQRSRGRNGAVS